MDSVSRNARRARVRLVVIAVATAAAVVAGGVWTVASLTQDENPSSGPGSATEASPSPSASGADERMTPAKAKPVKLLEPERRAKGVALGFPANGMGAISAAVARMEELPLLDDIEARKRLEPVTSKDAPDYIDKEISKIRAFRENLGLPPSGASPGGMVVETTVNAVRGKSIADNGKVVQVWINYDRHATKSDSTPAGKPLEDETTDLILKWEDGDWKLTDEAKYESLGSYPVTYLPDSPVAWIDGWWRVTHG